MPIYEYYCPKCESKFELLRTIAHMDDPAECPRCQEVSRRAVTTFSCRTKDESGSVAPAASSCSSCSSTDCSSCNL